MAKSIPFDRAVDYYDETRGFPAGQETSVAALMAEVGGLHLRQSNPGNWHRHGTDCPAAIGACEGNLRR